VEIYNDGTESVDVTGFKFNDGSNHVLNSPPKNGGQGSAIIPQGGYAILAGNALVFLSDHSQYSGVVIDTVMNLNNTGGALSLIDENGIVVNQVSYDKSLGGNGDGNSLQKVEGNFRAGPSTPGVLNFSGDILNNNPNNPVSTSETNIQATSPVVGSAWKTDPQIFPNAGVDRTVLVGAEVLFNGSALGVKKEPLQNARYIWNFGDGATKEGQNVLHIFRQPGEYIATLDVSSGDYSQGDVVNIKVIPAKISIGKIESGVNGFVEVINGSTSDIDVSGFKLQSGNATFTFPKGTILKAGKTIRFSNEITSLNPTVSVQLLYPSGSPVVFSASGESQIVQSIKSSPTLSTSKSLPIEKSTNIAEASSFNTNETNNYQNDKSSGIINWIIALVALIGVSSGAVLFLRRPIDPADGYEIVE
jgi:hypothetical protein